MMLFRSFIVLFTFIYTFSIQSYTTLDKGILDKLIITFAPEIRFHKHEEFFPSSTHWYTQRCSLYKREKNGNSTLVLPKPVHASVLQQYPPLDYPASFNQLNDYYLDPDKDKETRSGEPLINNECKATCYAHVQDKSNGGIVIQYIFFYPYQGYTVGLELAGKSLFDVGSHEGDWEHVDVHLGKSNHPDNTAGYVVEQVYYAAHGNKPHGKLLYAREAAFIDKTHPIVWAAKFGHASHEKNVNFDIATLDSTSNDGVRWRCWQSPLINIGDLDHPTPGQEWLQFGGRWGSTKEVVGKKLTTHVTNSPQGPGIGTPWWRYTQWQYEKIGEFRVNNRSGRASDLFDLDGKIPTRVRNLRWEISNSPQSNDLLFFVHERKRIKAHRKNVYGPISHHDVTPKSPHTKGLYIADIKTKSGAPVKQPFMVTLFAMEE